MQPDWQDENQNPKFDDLADWEWGEPPDVASTAILAAHQESCRIGAEVALRQAAEDPTFLVGCTEDDITACIPVLDNFSITGTIDIFEQSMDWAADEALRLAGVLRRLADKIEAEVKARPTKLQLDKSTS